MVSGQDTSDPETVAKEHNRVVAGSGLVIIGKWLVEGT